jgi:hypothetical protein
MIAIYRRVPEKEIRKGAKDAIVKITDWFIANPKRRVCNAEFWYGKQTKVRRNHIVEDINKAAEKALA